MKKFKPFWKRLDHGKQSHLKVQFRSGFCLFCQTTHGNAVCKTMCHCLVLVAEIIGIASSWMMRIPAGNIINRQPSTSSLGCRFGQHRWVVPNTGWFILCLIPWKVSVNLHGFFQKVAEHKHPTPVSLVCCSNHTGWWFGTLAIFHNIWDINGYYGIILPNWL